MVPKYFSDTGLVLLSIPMAFRFSCTIDTTSSWPPPVLKSIVIGPLSELPAAFQSSNSFWAASLSNLQYLQMPSLNPGMPGITMPVGSVREPSYTFLLIWSRSMASEMALRSPAFFSPAICGLSLNPKSKWYEPSVGDLVVLPYFDVASAYWPDGIVAVIRLPDWKSVYADSGSFEILKVSLSSLAFLSPRTLPAHL